MSAAMYWELPARQGELTNASTQPQAPHLNSICNTQAAACVCISLILIYICVCVRVGLLSAGFHLAVYDLASCWHWMLSLFVRGN